MEGMSPSLFSPSEPYVFLLSNSKITTGPSRKTSYVVLGAEAGPKKLEIIREYKLKTIGEEGLFHLIRTLPANGGDHVAAKQNEAKKAEEEKKVREMAKVMDKESKCKGKEAAQKEADQLWTVKYAPTQITQICGNKGQVEKLQNWLRNWPKNLKSGFENRGPDGTGVYRVVMIHGPPGIGKTSAAHLVAKLEGYDIVESNASDTRSKKLMEVRTHQNHAFLAMTLTVLDRKLFVACLTTGHLWVTSQAVKRASRPPSRN